MTDLAMAAVQATPASTTCPTEGCLREAPHEGVRHRFAPTKELQASAPAPAATAPAPAAEAVARLNAVEKRPYNGPVEDRPINHAISIVEDGLHVAWDNCYRCKTHITLCACKEGPMEPPYITSWRAKDFPINKQTKNDLPQAVQAATPVEEPAPEQPEPAVDPDGQPSVADADYIVDEPEWVPKVADRSGTHVCTACGEALYLADSPDGPRAFTVDGDENRCTVDPTGIHFAVEATDTSDADVDAGLLDDDSTPAMREAPDSEPDSEPDTSEPDTPIAKLTPVQIDAASSTIDEEVGF